MHTYHIPAAALNDTPIWKEAIDKTPGKCVLAGNQISTGKNLESHGYIDNYRNKYTQEMYKYLSLD